MSSHLIAGRNPVMEALKAGASIEKIMILFGVKGNVIEKIRATAREKKIPCVETDKQKFRDFAGEADAQGVVALLGTKKYSEIEDLLAIARELRQKPFLLILDEIEDPQNLGAMIRTAECAGVHGVIIPKHHAASVNRTVSKASAGATEHMAIAKVTNLVSTMEQLKEAGLWMIGTDMDGGKSYDQIDYSIPLALIIGSEGSGMRRLVKEKCDFLIRIPMFGKIQSLNASVAAALVMYEVVRNRKAAQRV
ncbi:MAG: 23S rRNA (guanosine(2251)-2'-O)-methyltransferase RlmB [Bacteroidota bacterium]